MKDFGKSRGVDGRMLKVEHKYKVTCALLNKGILIERVAYITSKDRVEDMDVESIQSAINDYLEIDDSNVELLKMTK